MREFKKWKSSFAFEDDFHLIFVSDGFKTVLIKVQGLGIYQQKLAY